MSKTILANVDGFTPCIDILTKEYGIMTAAVFGRVWRYCQWERGVCDASLETIAVELQMGYMTILRHIKMLVKDGYLKDLTPELRNKPHTYQDTGKVHVVMSVLAGLSERESGSTTEIDPGLPEREMKKVIKKVIKKESSRKRDARLDHPALIAYKIEARLHVPIAWRDEVIDTVDNPERFRGLVHDWIGHGWNKQNIQGMLEAYSNGGISKNGRSKPKRVSVLDKLAEEMRNG